MKIQRVEIQSYQVGGGRHAGCEGLQHIKALPFLSVVQSLEGSYDIALDGGSVCSTGAGGAFIAPAQAVQTIVHHVDPASGYMQAQWVFLEVLLNGTMPLDSVFQLPLLWPAEYRTALCAVFEELNQKRGICRDYSAIYRLLDILLQIATPRHLPDPLTDAMLAYVRNHFAEKICYADFAACLNISESGLFRKFRTEFRKTPANYINEFRILHAASLLETDTRSVKEIAAAVGFEDEFYFSKLFKQQMRLSPSAYRNTMRL